MSIDKFIEYNWEIPPLTQNVADSNNLLDFFYFSGAPRSPIILGQNGPYSYTSYPIPIQIPLANLPYARSGLPNETYSAPNATPFNASSMILTVVLVVVIATALLATYKSRSRGRQASFEI
jgi:hypothetical protein